MKKIIKLISVITGIVLISGFSIIKYQRNEDRYFVAYGWEYPKGGGKKQPVVSNVVFYNCKFISSAKTVEIRIELQFAEFYKSYYRKSRDTQFLTQVEAQGFDTKDKAEKKRRELIALYNGYVNSPWEPLLISDFSVLCED